MLLDRGDDLIVNVYWKLNGKHQKSLKNMCNWLLTVESKRIRETAQLKPNKAEKRWKAKKGNKQRQQIETYKSIGRY